MKLITICFPHHGKSFNTNKGRFGISEVKLCESPLVFTIVNNELKGKSMRWNRQRTYVTLTAFFLLVIYSTSLPAHAIMAGEVHPDNTDAYRGPVNLGSEVVILYSPSSEQFRLAATSLDDSIRVAYLNTRLVPVTGVEEINIVLGDPEKPLVVMWAFETNLKGLIVSEALHIPWRVLADVIGPSASSGVNHIIGLGNTEELIHSLEAKGYPTDKVYTQPTLAGVVDIMHMFLFNMWQLAEIFLGLEGKNEKSYNIVGENIRNLGLRFFEQNVNELMERNVEPKAPIGEVNKTQRQEMFDELKSQYPRGIVKKAKFNPLTDANAPPMYFKSNAEVMAPGDKVLESIPLTSGLQGPIGFILDALFQLLADEGESDVVISGETIELIFDIFEVVKSLVGGNGLDASAASALKSLLDVLANEFPFGEQLLPYMKLIVDGLFALKGDWDSISRFIQNLIDTLIPESASTLRTVVSSVVNITADVVSSLQSGEELLTVLMKTLSSNLMSSMALTLLNNTLGVSESTFNEYREKILAVVQIVIDLIAGDVDVVDLLVDNFENIFIYALDLIPEAQQEVVEKLGMVVAFGYSILNTDKKKLLDRAVELLEEFIPDSVADKVGKVRSTAEYLVKVIGDIREQGLSATSTIKGLVDSIYGNLTSVLSTDLVKLLKEATLWIFSALNKNIPESERDEYPALDEVLLAFFDYVNADLLAAESKPGEPTKPQITIDSQTIDDIRTVVNYAMQAYSLVTQAPEIAQTLTEGSEVLFEQFKEDPVGTITPVLVLIFGDNSTIITTYLPKLESFAEIALSIYQIISSGEIASFQGVMRVLTLLVSTGIFDNFPIDIATILEVVKNLYPGILNVANAPTPLQAVDAIIDLIPDTPEFSTIKNYAEIVLEVIYGAREIFSNGLKWLFGQIVEWLGRQVEELVNTLLDKLVSAIAGSAAVDDKLVSGKAIAPNSTIYDRGLLTENGTRSKLTSAFGDPLLTIEIPADFGGFSLFQLTIEIGLKPNFGFDTDGFKELLTGVIFDGKKLFEGGAGEFFERIFGFLEISPLLTATLDLGGFGTEENSFMNFLLESLGLKLSFSGSGYFAMNLLTFSGGEFKFENFLKVVEWGFTFTITVSRDFTLLDFLTGGVGGGVLNKVAEFLGLGGIIVTIAFGLTIEVIKRAASASGPEEASFTLKIFISATITIGISLVIVGIELWGSVEIILTFFQDLANPSPLQIFLDVIFRFGVTLTFIAWDWDSEWKWHAVHLDLSPSSPSDQKENGAKGLDADSDGLSDDYEKSVPGLDPESEDSDGDGLTDKYETQISGTDPSKADTDGDGLSDPYEIETSKTNPKNRDSDYDGLSDADEVNLYKTNPLQRDTDGDGLDDNFEVTHSWNLTVTPSVKEVFVGGVPYNDHTDPLVADTDGDGLLDGQEGERGPYYGDPLLRPSSVDEEHDIVFNGGYTHPLDNDTDDDSFEQLVNGTISFRNLYLRDMTDGVEIDGQEITFVVEGEPELRIVRTNPVRPDSDGDTGYTGTMNPAPINRFLNSDGYELSLDPPSDPLDGDTDDDGLIDGLEGTLAYDSNRTNYNNPDTDGDGLGDLQELLLGSNPLDVDTDNDMVTDGDEYLKYGTSVFLNDTDMDGILDGQELFWFHTSPFLRDSDGDGLGDAAELFDYYSDPLDDDSDNDGLSDYEEVIIYGTLVKVADTDGDQLLDGFEVNVLKTSPFLWDTDNDSIYYHDPTQQSGISMKWGDYEEHMSNQSDPTISDTDKDGINDGWEQYLASGHAPFLDPIPLDLANNDTDGDGLLDGQELLIGNSTNLIYPFISFHLIYQYNTSPVLADSDQDGLNDSAELRVYLTDPANNDTDGDFLTDYEEVMFHKTNPRKGDTDGDGLLDSEEQTAAVLMNGTGLPASSMYNVSAVYPTNATNPDTDGDYLPDGAELFLYFNTSYGINTTYDPTNPDENNNSILDGLELDSDYDGLPDGLEFRGNQTGSNPYNSTYDSNVGGGPFHPDSDRDGLPDGLEVFNLFTSPVSNDTDKDSFPDGLEVRLDLDPLANTSWAEFVTAMGNYTIVMISSPVAASYVGTIVPIKVNAPSDALRVTYRIYEPQSQTWSDEEPLTWDGSDHTWTVPSVYEIFSPGNYLLRSYVYLDTGEILMDNVNFAVQTTLVPFSVESAQDLTNAAPSSIISSAVIFTLIGLFTGLTTATQLMRKRLRKESNQQSLQTDVVEMED